MKEQGIEPAPSRKKQMSWSEYRRAHWGAIAAWDFLTVEVLTLRGLVRYHVLIVIDLASRRVEIGGIAHEPTGAWMMQAVRNLLDAEEGFLTGTTKLIMDRDPVFTADVRTLLRSGGVELVRLPARSPNLNAFAERFVLSIKSECLNRLVLLGEAHLRLAVREYVAHYNSERPHQGLEGRFVGPPANENMTASIQCRERLGALLCFASIIGRLHDCRDRVYGHHAGVEPVRLPARCPNLNAFAERFGLGGILSGRGAGELGSQYGARGNT